jgi:glycosyltransferase involved in cell wall biosynthesis
MLKRVSSNSLPRISVVIPSFNKVKYIGETLNSIVFQKYPNLEIIIEDGGSSDGTVKVIADFAKKYPDVIKWESKKDKGQLDAINRGLRKSTGDILVYINADDIYKPGGFKKVANKYIQNPKSMWFLGTADVINSNGEKMARLATLYKKLLTYMNNYQLLLFVNYLMQPATFLTRKAYLKYGPFTGTRNFITEYDLWLKIGRVQMPEVIPNELASFRISQGSITTNQSEDLLNRDMDIVKKYTKNQFILDIHKLHNAFRILFINLL